ncbi:30893_t:CDS:2, partial [Gigaspora margarita]
EDELVNNEHVEGEFIKSKYIQDKSLEDKTCKPMENEFKDVECLKVDLVKEKAVEFVQSEHIDVELVESEKNEDIEIDQDYFESNDEINTPVLGLEFEGLDFIKHYINQFIELVVEAQAFLSDETQESYEWVLQQTLDATSSKPRVIMTDMDPAMDAACQVIYKNFYHVHCIWHMSQNLSKWLKAKLESTNFKEFVCDFWKAQNSLKKNPSANKYLSNPIYSTQRSWAKLFICRIFTAGMQSTSRVESINAIIYKAVSSSSSILDVVQALELLGYQSCFEFEDQLDSNEYDSQMNYSNHAKVENIEDYYDLKQICLKELLKSISKESVKEVWQVVPYIAPNSYQYMLSSGQIKLSDRHVYDYNDIEDPIAHKSKGRPPYKRLKAFNEETNMASSSSSKAQYDNVDNDSETRCRCELYHNIIKLSS